MIVLALGLAGIDASLFTCDRRRYTKSIPDWDVTKDDYEKALSGSIKTY